MQYRNEDARTPASAGGTPRTFILDRITPRMWLANQTAAAGWDVVQKTADLINASPGAGLISAISKGQFNISHERAQAVLKELGYVASSVERRAPRHRCSRPGSRRLRLPAYPKSGKCAACAG